MPYDQVSIINRLNKIDVDNSIFILMLYFQIIQRFQQFSLCRVASLKGLPVHRYSAVIFNIFCPFRIIRLKLNIWKQIVAQLEM